MFFGRANRLTSSTPLRLTLGFLIFYIAGSAAVFGYLNYQFRATLVDQIDSGLRDRERSLKLRYYDQGFNGVYRAILSEIAAKGKSERFYRVLDKNGTVLLEIGDLNVPRLAPFDGIRDVELPSSRRDEQGAARVSSFTIADQLRVYQAISMSGATALMDRFWHVFLRTEALVLLLGLGFGFWLARRFWSQIESFNAVARQIVNSGNLSGRMPVTGSDEFASLATNLNAMLERIEKLFQGIRQVSDNIAHDLRSPLTRLRADVEVALQGDDPQILRETLERVLDELQNMQNTFNSLLSIGQAEAGSLRLRKNRLDLSELLDSLVELYTPSLEENNLSMEAEIKNNLLVNADRQLIAQVFSNLFDNAIKYVPSGGKIALYAAMRDNQVEIVMEDSGPGIPADKREKVFDRFTRLDPSRTLPGSGLGLSLVRAFIELHKGRISLTDSRLGGARFSIILPAY